MTRFEQYCKRQHARYGDKFTAPQGAALIDAYNKGDRFRVKVETRYPNSDYVLTRWGHVALTTGWRPSFMLMRHRRQMGSSDLLNTRDRIIAAHWL